MIGELIARRRRALGLSQVELGRRTGTSQRQVSRLENGEDGVLPRRDTLERYGAVLGITLAEFYQTAGLMEPPVDTPSRPAPPALADVIALMEADPAIMAEFAHLRQHNSDATYRRALATVAESLRNSARFVNATLDAAAIARPAHAEARDDGE